MFWNKCSAVCTPLLRYFIGILSLLLLKIWIGIVLILIPIIPGSVINVYIDIDRLLISRLCVTGM